MSTRPQTGRRRLARSLVVAATLLGLSPQFVGCSASRIAGRKPSVLAPAAAAKTAAAESAGSKEVALASVEAAEGRTEPLRTWWRGSKLRRDIRRGTHAGKEGVKEATRLARIAAVWTMVGSVIAGLLWLNGEADDGNLSPGPDDGTSLVGSN
ncbi:hypothetical protein OJF2_47490 [Aquisphaera giovannonii]|uniref:Transmembrane protein n=1 Tax=Aquisphaera giovannonii TaxID=406548 RepID=A0A5B9W7S8_9BACT|nr:hypothetical protein [Aquisphaera giovannonii]QEH36189.1 hypothetical protein OJF2_47490 [Aquisphaera giovannonii]